LLGRRDSRSRTGSDGAESPVEPDDAEEPAPEPEADAAPEPEANAEPEPEADAEPEPEADAEPEPEADAAPEPEADAAPEPEADAAPEPEPDPSKREPFVPPPHWPAPRYVSRRKMMRGHVRAPVDEPLLTERELHLVLGLAAMAVGFVVVGLFGLVGLYLVLGNELFRALEEFFAVVLGPPG
jgi:hypothetical protein